MQPRLHRRVVDHGPLRQAGHFEEASEQFPGRRAVMEVVAGAGEGADQQGSTLAEGVFDGGSVAVRVLAGSFTAQKVVVLAEVAAIDFAALHLQRQLIGEVGVELDVLLARAEQRIKPEVRLRGSNVATVAEVSGQALADKGAAVLHVFLQTVRCLLLQHYWIGEIDELVFVDIFERDEVSLDVGIEEGLIRAADGLGVVLRATLLDVVEEFGLGNKKEGDIAFHWTRLPDIRMRIRPLCDLARHFGSGSYGAVHRERAKRAEEGTIEQRPPARVEDATGATRAGDQVPDAHIFRVGLAAVFAGPADDLRLHPERARFGFRVPERLAPRAPAGQGPRPGL